MSTMFEIGDIVKHIDRPNEWFVYIILEIYNVETKHYTVMHIHTGKFFTSTMNFYKKLC